MESKYQKINFRFGKNGTSPEVFYLLMLSRIFQVKYIAKVGKPT